MAKYKAGMPAKAKASIYPSECGSHKSMLDPEYASINEDDVNVFAVCKDDRGPYLTSKKLLDNGLCDYNRSANTDIRDERMKELNS